MGTSQIRGPAEAKALAARLNGNERARPSAVVSTPATSEKPWIDVEELVAEFGPLVDVYLITTGPATWALTESLPHGTQVYGGAGRVYPVGHEWTGNLSRSPLRFAFDTASGHDATRALVADGFGMAAAAGLLRARPAQPMLPASGIVKGLPTPDRAVVELSNRQLATVAQELTVPDVPLDRILARGMHVVGMFDSAQKRLDIRQMIRLPETITYEPGQVALAVVTNVEAEAARFRLFPGLEVSLERAAITSNENDDLRSFFTVGEVTGVRVLANGPYWALSLIDIDDDELPSPTLSIVEGGPPWVVAPPPPEPWAPHFEVEVELSEPEPLALPQIDVPADPSEVLEPSPSAPKPGPSPMWLDPKRRSDHPQRPANPVEEPAGGDLLPVISARRRAHINHLHNTITSFKAEMKTAAEKLQALQAERDLIASRLSHSQAEITGLKSDAKRLRTELRKKSRADPQHSPATSHLFVHPEEQLRHDIYSAWTSRVLASDKAEHPLPDFAIGQKFLESLDELEGIKPEKVHDVVVEVLTGLVKQIAGRELHRLRTAASGGAPPVTRDDGAVAWRASLQVGSPAARRLHYWQLPDGTIELSKVCVHNDFTI